MHHAMTGPRSRLLLTTANFTQPVPHRAAGHWPVKVKSALADSPARTVTERSCVPNEAVHTESV